MATGIIWSLGKSPGFECYAEGGVPVMVTYGFPTTYVCQNSSNAPIGAARLNTPSCFGGMHVDFVLQRCIDDVVASGSSGGASSGGLPPMEDVAAVWAVGFCMVVMCFLIARSIGAILEFIRFRR